MRCSVSPPRPLLPLLAAITLASGGLARAAEPAVYSGIYPHLAMYARDPAEPRPANLHPRYDGECGTGAVVPWAGRLWVITYAPHADRSQHKLYEITPDLKQIIRPESVGGTPANRLIHRESEQLFIGPYAINAKGDVRVIPPATMPGRLTGSARHLVDPANKIYTATMEQGFYEVDVHSLSVKILYPDADDKKNGGKYFLPGYHGKGLYSGQGVLVFSNNGERGTNRDLKAPSGVLASWNGQDWTTVRRNQFVEVTGPGGIFGNTNPATDPIWATGWDTRSVLLQVLDGGQWTSYRLPKSSHSYDGVQGWNTEWPRIREIGERDLLMTMHGAFFRFPAGFRPGATAGIRPRSNYLKVVGDFARWGDRVVLGTDDTARSEFYNKSGRKGDLIPPGVSQSNLWFVAPDDLDRVGPVIGRGSVWLGDAVAADTPSDSYLFSGYSSRCLHLRHSEGHPVRFTLEVDLKGDGRWSKLRDVEVPASGYARVDFDPAEIGEWIRVRSAEALSRASATFAYRNADSRSSTPDGRFGGLAAGDAPRTSGLLHTGTLTVRYLASDAEGKELGAYELALDAMGRPTLAPTSDPGLADTLRTGVAIPSGYLDQDAASVVFTENGKRWRLPRNPGASPALASAPYRYCREVSTERDLFNADGIFYEFPSETAGGAPFMRAIAAHPFALSDYTGWRGLIVLAGVATDRASDSDHIVRSTDGKTGLWLGAIDDLWKLGKARGIGGPWLDTAVTAGQPSDPYLLSGFDRKTVTLSHGDAAPLAIRLEVDITGLGAWQTYDTFTVAPGETRTHVFPEAFGGYWIRAVADRSTTATVQFHYE